MISVVRPSRFQRRILITPENMNLFLGGGRGGGKSTGSLFACARHETQYGARSRQLVVRPDNAKGASDFEDQAEALYKQAFSPSRVSRNRQEHLIRVKDGGTLEFSALDKEAYDKFQGRQFSQLVADEAGNFTSLKLLDKLRSNLRMPGVPTRLIISANPGGPAHAELARRYVTGRKAWRPFVAKDGEEWICGPSTLQDNAHLDRAMYMKRLAAAVGTSDPALLAAWVTGDWSKLSGSFFAPVMGDGLWIDDYGPDAWRDVFKGGPWWQTYLALDWGLTAPSVVLLGARCAISGAKDPEGNTYLEGDRVIVEELSTAQDDDPNVGAGWPVAMLAEEVLARCEQWGVDAIGVADDARGLDGSTLCGQFAAKDVMVKRPMKDRISGWAKLKGMMKAATGEDDEAIAKAAELGLVPDEGELAGRTDAEGEAVWLSTRCRYLAETLPILQRNQIRPEDVSQYPKQPDHGADALRYFVNHEPPAIAVTHPAILLPGRAAG